MLTELGKRHPVTNTLQQSFENENWGKWFGFIKTNKISGKTLMQANNYPLFSYKMKFPKEAVAQLLSDQSWIWKKIR